jgi:hypothetical protein
MQSDIKSGANLDKYDRVDLYNELKRMVPNKPSGIYFEIADDMMKRKLTYRDMSSRQKYRFNQAIDKLLDQIPGRPANNSTSGSSNTGDTTTQQPKATSVNNTYLLDERQDIATNVNRLVKLADSVEMNAVLAAEPNVLNICYSILRYKKASDRQLLHVNNAIKILDEQ